jgi:hypothetical protein
MGATMPDGGSLATGRDGWAAAERAIPSLPVPVGVGA